jgi:hypothetical protein
MRCHNIAKNDNDRECYNCFNSLYINPNGLCNKCQLIKDKRIKRKLRKKSGWGSLRYP